MVGISSVEVSSLSPLQFQSRLINNLRFPLAVLVIIIHSSGFNFMDAPFQLQLPCFSLVWLNSFCSILIQCMANSVAVPFFFLISGYLFFLKVTDFSLSVYLDKLKSRVNTILVPYLLWNVLFVPLCGYRFIFIHGDSLLDFVNRINSWLFFWNSGSGLPLLDVFWFLKALIIFVLLSPLVYLLLRWLGAWALVVFLVITMFFPHCFCGAGFFLWFAIGAYFGLFKRTFFNIFFRLRLLGYVLFPALSVFIVLYRGYGLDLLPSQVMIFFNVLCTMAGIIAFSSLFTVFTQRGHVINSFLSSATFFVYAFHSFIAYSIGHHYRLIFGMPDGITISIFGYALHSLLLVFSCLVAYWLLRRFMPRVCSVLCGGR